MNDKNQFINCFLHKSSNPNLWSKKYFMVNAQPRERYLNQKRTQESIMEGMKMTEREIIHNEEIQLESNYEIEFFDYPVSDPKMEGRRLLTLREYDPKKLGNKKFDALKENQILELIEDGIKFRVLKEAEKIKKRLWDF